MASTWASSETSQTIASALWPWAVNSSAAERTAFSFQSASATEAPDSANAFAVAKPMPEAAPVTSATLFSKDMFIMSSSLLKRVVTRFLVERVPLALNFRLINFLCPIPGIDFFERDGNDFFFSVQNGHHIPDDSFRKTVLLLLRTSGRELYDDM